MNTVEQLNAVLDRAFEEHSEIDGEGLVLMCRWCGIIAPAPITPTEHLEGHNPDCPIPALATAIEHIQGLEAEMAGMELMDAEADSFLDGKTVIDKDRLEQLEQVEQELAECHDRLGVTMHHWVPGHEAAELQDRAVKAEKENERLRHIATYNLTDGKAEFAGKGEHRTAKLLEVIGDELERVKDSDKLHAPHAALARRNFLYSLAAALEAERK